MLSNHEYVCAIRELYPLACSLEDRILRLFNQQFPPGRGPTGVCGNNEADFMEGRLIAAANMLKRLNAIHNKI